MMTNIPRTLDLNLPLLSTKRHTSASPAEDDVAHSTRGVNSRVPFSWEQSPGKPKIKETLGDIINVVNGEGINSTDTTPRPRLPPRLRHLENQDLKGGVRDHGDTFTDDNMSLTKAMDEISLTEAIDIAQRVEDRGFDRLNLESSAEFVNNNFLIERFLPDAAALAVSTSALLRATTIKKRQNHHQFGLPRVRQGCGALNILFPWRPKHKLCGVDHTPVLRKVPHQPCNPSQCGPKQRMNHHGSSK